MCHEQEWSKLFYVFLLPISSVEGGLVQVILFVHIKTALLTTYVYVHFEIYKRGEQVEYGHLKKKYSTVKI